MDWHDIFRSFYETVRIQVAVRDLDKIPEDRLVEILQDLYLLTFSIEKGSYVPSPHDPSDPRDGDSNSRKDKDDLEDVDDDDLLGDAMDLGQGKTTKKASVSRATPAPRASKSANLCATPVHVQKIDKTIFSKLQGAPISKSYVEIVKKRHVDNISAPLLSQFDESVVCRTTTSVDVVPRTNLPKIPRSKSGKWGPLVASRVSCRIKRDGIPMMQRAQDFKKFLTSRSLEMSYMIFGGKRKLKPEIDPRREMCLKGNSILGIFMLWPIKKGERSR